MKAKLTPATLSALGILIFGLSFLLYPKKQDPTHAQTPSPHQVHTTQDSQAYLKNNKDLDSLKKAYTGNWFKNKASSQEEGTFGFPSPENTRNTLATQKQDPKKNAKKDNKKKKKNKAKLQAFKKRAKPQGRRASSPTSSNLNPRTSPTYASNMVQTPNAQDPISDQEDSNEQKWTVEELFSQATENHDITMLVQLFKSGKISNDLFYGVVDRLFQEENEAHHSLGFLALSQTPSILSLSKHVSYLATEKSDAVKALATQYLEIYKDISNVNILNIGLNSQEPQIQNASALYLQKTADYLIKTQSSDSSGDNRNPSSIPHLVLSRYIYILQKSLRILESHLQSGDLSPQLVAIFNQSKSQIDYFLNQTAYAQQNLAAL